MHDTDTQPGPASQPNQPVQLVTTAMGFQHPPDFKPAAFAMIGMTKEGQPFVNMPIEQPHLCLHLATLLLAQASKRAVEHMQAQLMEKPLVLAPPPGLVIPTWQGPAGRG